MPLDLSHTGQYKEETDDTPDEVADDVNESLGRLEEENPNLADPLTDPILDQATTSLAHWFRNPYPHGEIMELLKQVECPQNCEGLKVFKINDTSCVPFVLAFFEI